MGRLVDGQWRTDWYDTSEGGRFQRPTTRFHGRVEAKPGATFPAAAGRYHLYVSLACPWAHRTLIARKLKKLEDTITVSVVDPFMGDEGWSFGEGPGTTPDAVNGFTHLHQVYTKADAHYSGRVTVPVLFDKEAGTIVNNESAEILRMMSDSGSLGALGDERVDLCPDELRPEIDAVNARVYEDVNDGVYRTGFATTQGAYEEAFDRLFAAFDWLEARLGEQRWLVGNRFTEADVRLFATLVRFDAVYYTHFKCNLRRVVDYPALWGFVRDVYQTPGIAETVSFDHIKRHYFQSHPMINPTRIVPKGPALDFTGPHGRERLGPR